MAENKKISQLNPAVAFTGAEKFELLQGGLNLYGTPEQMKNYIGGITREFNRAPTTDLLFNYNVVQMNVITQTGPVTFTIDDSETIDQESVITTEFDSNGVDTVDFEGFQYFSNIAKGEILPAGTYQFWFSAVNGRYTVSVVKPSSQASNLLVLGSPENFAVVADGDTEIDASWDNNANASGFERQYSISGGSGPWIELSPNLAAGSTSFSHTGLTPGQTYHYRARWLGDGVTYANSNWVTAAATTENSGDPGAPTFTFSPADSATDVPVNGVVTITASIPIRDQDGATVITDANISDYLTVKEDDGSGSDIPYTATIDVTKTIITITPNVIWPANGDVFIEIDGVEGSTNAVHALAADATFSVSEYTLNNNNYLNFGDTWIDGIIAVNDANFNIKFTAKDLNITSGTLKIVRKYETGNLSLLINQVNSILRFRWYSGSGSSVPIREVSVNGAFVSGEHDYDIGYRGAIDTNNGADRIIFKRDGVVTGTPAVTAGTTSWPFGIADHDADFEVGPIYGQVKDLIITSNDDTVTELNVPIIRTGLDVSGNDRHGVWF